jgi:hypothetical protein
MNAVVLKKVGAALEWTDLADRQRCYEVILGKNASS